MTITEVIDNVKRIKLGSILDNERIIADINRAEEMVLREVVSGREGEEAYMESYGGYDGETSQRKLLLVPAPYDTLYLDYCCAMIEKEQENGERYTNHMLAFNNALSEFKRYFWKQHRQSAVHQFYERGY